MNELQVAKEQVEFDLKIASSKLKTQALPQVSDGEAVPESGSTEDLQVKFNAEIAQLRQEHMAYVDKLKNQYDEQVLAYKTSSNTASQEWHNIEHDLANERSSHLATVKDFRECREKLTQKEIESNERAAELLQEVEAAQKMLTLVGK